MGQRCGQAAGQTMQEPEQPVVAPGGDSLVMFSRRKLRNRDGLGSGCVWQMSAGTPAGQL